MPFVSYAQNFEDVMLWRAFKSVERGVYVDVGAQDPVADSVSMAFHEAGWRGVHVEPSAHYCTLLRAARPGDVVIQAAVSEAASLVKYFEIAGTGISTIDPDTAARHAASGYQVDETTVVGVTLEAVFAACGNDTIHWLKLDIEGAERQALQSWGSDAYRPLVLVVESTLPLSRADSSEQWEQLVLQRGYDLAYFDGLNRFYVVRERADLKALLSVPPNVFDGFAVSGLASSQVHAAVEARWKAKADSARTAHRDAERAHDAERSRLDSALAQATQAQARLQDDLSRAEQRCASLSGTLEVLSAESERLQQENAALSRRVEQSNARSADLVQARAVEAGEAMQQLAATGQALSRAMQDASNERQRVAELHRRMLQQLQADNSRRLADADRRHDDAAQHWTAQFAAAEARIATLADHLTRADEVRQVAVSDARTAEAELLRTKGRLAEAEHALQQAASTLRERDDEVAQRTADQERLTVSLVATAHETRRLSRALDSSRQRADDLATALQAEAMARQAAEADLAGVESRLTDCTLLAQELRQQVGTAQAGIEAAREQIGHLEAVAAAAALDHARALADERAASQARVEALEATQSQALSAQQQLQREADAAHAAELGRLAQELDQCRAESQALAAQLSATTTAISELRSSTRGRLMQWLGMFPRFAVLMTDTPTPSAQALAASAPATGSPMPAVAAPTGRRDVSPKPPEIPVLDKLLVLNDLEFVHAAYHTVLKRAPDPTGERNYVELMRAGVDKLIVLAALVDSDEGRKAGAVVPGLAAARWRHRVSRMPVFGPFAGALFALLRPARAFDPTRAYVNQSTGLQRAAQAMLGQLQASVEEIRQRQERMEGVVRRLSDRQDEVSASVAALQAQIVHATGPSAPSAGVQRTPAGGAEAVAAASQLENPPDLRLDLLRKASAWKT